MAEIIETDVLVVGGGGAAARAAIEASQTGARVLLAVKGEFGAIGTRGAGATASGVSEFGAMAAPGWKGPVRNYEAQLATMLFNTKPQDFANIIQVGLGMADPRLAKILVDEAADSRATLEKWGYVSSGGWGLKTHGVPIMSVLERMIRTSSIIVREETMITDLWIQDGLCAGATGVNETTGDILHVKAGATVIATGGDANLFMFCLSPPCVTGDGYAMGYEAGAELMNMEFKQIFLGTVYPTKNMLLFSLPPGVRLINVKGEEFIQNYLPRGASVSECLAQRTRHNPFSTRDTLSRYVDIAMIREVKEGRGNERNALYLDHTAPNISPISSHSRDFWLYRGIDFKKGPVEFAVHHHCSLGGFRIDENAQTTIPGLYAAGECAAGPHGADRMGGHMLAASQVFGARAGKNAAGHAKKHKLPINVSDRAEKRIKHLQNRKGDVDPSTLKKELQKCAWENLLVIRSEGNLNKVLEQVERARKKFDRLSIQQPQQLIEALELQNLMQIAEIEARVCLTRTESRGPHYREDFPEQDNKNWLKSITVKKVDGDMKIGTIVLDSQWGSVGEDKVKDWG